MPSNRRNDTVRTDFVASLGNFQIGIIRTRLRTAYRNFAIIFRRTADDGNAFFLLLIFLQNLRQSEILVDPQQYIDLGDFLVEISGIALRQTSGSYENRTFFSVFRHLKNRVDGFLFCIVDKTAGIYDDRSGFFRRIHDDVTVLLQESRCIF